MDPSLEVLMFPVDRPFSPSSRSEDKSSGRRAFSSKVKRKVLDNGLTVLIIESHELPVVSHWIWYAVGSRDEKSNETGLSHFLEHMMFKGTDSYPKGSIDSTTARLGGSNNAMTSHDYTAYYFNLKSDRWEEALEIESSRMRHCLLDKVEFESEKKVVIEELKMGEDEPWRPLCQAVESIAYMVHPYRHPVIGWRDDLEGLTRDRMLDYYDRNYSPDRATLVVVGDVKWRDALGRIQEHMGQITASGHQREEVPKEPVQKGERRLVVRFPGNLPRLAMSWHTCRFGERDDIVLDMVSTLLSGGKSSRFYRSLVQGKELAASAEAINETRVDPGLFWILSEGKADTSPEALEAAVNEEVQKLADDGPKAAEMKRCKRMLLSTFYFDLETVSSQAARIGRAEALLKHLLGHRVYVDST
ncbi:MAG: M16 family metallopeptidase, partial [Planctomycetota bacterium]